MRSNGWLRSLNQPPFKLLSKFQCKGYVLKKEEYSANEVHDGYGQPEAWSTWTDVGWVLPIRIAAFGIEVITVA